MCKNMTPCVYLEASFTLELYSYIKYRNRNETRPGQVHAGSSFIILKYYSQNGLFAPFKLELMTLVQRLQMDIWCTHYMRPALRIIKCTINCNLTAKNTVNM